MYRSLHIHQIELKTKLDWFNHENTDTFIYCIIYPVLKIFIHNPSIWKTSEKIKNDLETIFSAAEYLLTKEFDDPYNILQYTSEHRHELKKIIKT